MEHADPAGSPSSQNLMGAAAGDTNILAATGAGGASCTSRGALKGFQQSPGATKTQQAKKLLKWGRDTSLGEGVQRKEK